MVWSTRLAIASQLTVLSLGCLPTAIAGQEPVMRVLLAEAKQLRLRSDGTSPLQIVGLGAGKPVKVQAISASLQSGQLTLELMGSVKRRLQLAPHQELRINSNDPRGVWLGNRRYRGELRLRSKGKALQVVNHLGVETYLASVVGSEMPVAWPEAALQAQAVAARTYALRQIGKSGPYDVKATVASQVYLGLESVTASTQQAVRSTRSLVLVHGGKLIDAVYHSSSGGATEASGAVWRNQLPYLVSVPAHDEHSPVHQWTEQFDHNQLRNVFRETGGVKSINAVRTSSTGRVKQAKIHGPSGSLVVSGRELRRRLGLKSTMIRFEMLTANSEIPSSKPRGAFQNPPPALQGFWHDSASGQRISVANKPTKSKRPTPLLRHRSVGPTKHAEAVLMIHGQGNGHGVGMSQWGAHGLAEKGADFRQILMHYYRGAEIRPYRQLQNPALVQRLPIAPLWVS